MLQAHIWKRFLCVVPIVQQVTCSHNVYLQHATEAVGVLQKWYDEGTGLYNSTGWWNTANCITVLADLTAINPKISNVTRDVFENTFEQAQKHNLHQLRTPYVQKDNRHAAQSDHPEQDPGYRKRGKMLVNGVQIEDANPRGFLNAFFDDESWWALAWMKVYGLTGHKQYLDAAEFIFQDFRTQAVNATCGGVWWDRAKTANTAISNALYISVAAQLVSHVPKRRAFYLKHALDNWRWFEASGVMNKDWQINDGIDLQTCQNDGKEIWSYNQGVILGALVQLNKLTGNKTYIDTATKIADAAISKMVDANGVLHDPREPNLGGDGNQFKGVFARNLKELWNVCRKSRYKIFLEKNANSIWNSARDEKGAIGTVWSGPFNGSLANAASHSSGLDALVAAAAVQGLL